MTVSLTISETLDGPAVNDVLATPGPDNRGVDFGNVINGAYAPLTNKSDNTGRKDLFIRHDAVVDPVTNFKTGIQEYGVGTGFGYAGADSAPNDFSNKLKAQGNTSGSSKNNADGNSGGLWIDMNALLADTPASAQFDHATNGINSAGSNGGDDTVRIYGDENQDGLIEGGDLTKTFQVVSEAMVIDADQAQGGGATNGWIPTGPVDGNIGKDGDTVLGDNAHIKLRVYARSDSIDGGIVQFEYVFIYSFTS